VVQLAAPRSTSVERSATLRRTQPPGLAVGTSNFCVMPAGLVISTW
jgi:hypothetical protein